MSKEICYRCRERPSKGSLGAMRYCCHCVADLLGWSDDPEKRQRLRRRRELVQLYNGPKKMGVTQWLPDAAVSIARESKR